ncbi:MAG: hypothetical protein HYU28_11600 [Actinobacteria bacterium]|nr:hypothetical protein [Actinomycetota bacterium]
MRMYQRGAATALIGALFLLGACDSDEDTPPTVETDAAEDTSDEEADSADTADDEDISVELPDPCALLQSDPDALAEVAGEVSGFDGPEDSEESFNGKSYGERTCFARGDRFEVQVELSPASIVYAPALFNDEEPVEGVGDGAYLLRNDEGKILDLVFKAGDVGGSIFLNFPGGELTAAEEPTEDDFVTIGRVVTKSIG